MSHKIIFPEGIELIEYLNRGYAICNECGALMERREDPRGGCDIYTCPSCGWEIDEMEYEYEVIYEIPSSSTQHIPRLIRTALYLRPSGV